MKRRIVADEKWEDYRLRYEMLEDERRGCFGAAITMRGDGYWAQAESRQVAKSREETLAFLDFLIRNDIMPKHLFDVLDDWYDDRAEQPAGSSPKG